MEARKFHSRDFHAAFDRFPNIPAEVEWLDKSHSTSCVSRDTAGGVNTCVHDFKRTHSQSGA
ncbi:MAG: hypothetical protein K2X27_01695 [Candidatus Obscuribacterales bacterium]|nr:hypothetical protein [Candidatus Obscuribacterales bacterium]